MARNRNEEQVRSVRIVRPEPPLPDVLEEIPLARVLAGELPRRLVERVGIPVRVYEHPEVPLHGRIVQPEDLGQVVGIGQLLPAAAPAVAVAVAGGLPRHLQDAEGRRQRPGGGRGGGRGAEGVEGDDGEGGEGEEGEGEEGSPEGEEGRRRGRLRRRRLRRLPSGRHRRSELPRGGGSIGRRSGPSGEEQEGAGAIGDERFGIVIGCCGGEARLVQQASSRLLSRTVE